MMHCVRSPARSRFRKPERKSRPRIAFRGWQADAGSQIIGFALVAPLVVFLAITSIQLGTVATQKVTAVTAAQSAAREFANLGGSRVVAKNVAERFTNIPGLTSCGQTLKFKRFQSGGVAMVEVRINRCIRVSSLQRNVHVTGIAIAVDESKL